MVFSSTIFLFAFLPTAIICYYAQRLLFKNGPRNITLLFLSLLFYLFGAAELIVILVLSTLADYVLGLLIDRDRRRKRLWLSLAICLNVGGLAYFKYTGFFVEELSVALRHLRLSVPLHEEVVLPLGISFFTFQKLSYVIDVYRGKTRAASNVIDFVLYVTMFPQLVAGPIIRFNDISRQLTRRMESWDLFHTGAIRFCWGLAKKVMVANSCGQIADVVFGLGLEFLDTKTAWLGALAYTLQIYIDFSAYSDMALGLGMMFGFEYPENFNRPYSAVSITDFWRRWHISLSLWLKDYLYIPFGGSRGSPFRTYLNLAAVFLLCGFWHGANYTFVFWGLYHGVFLIIERATGLRNVSTVRYSGVRRLVTVLIVMVGWVLFRSEDVAGAIAFLSAMFCPKDLPLSYELSLALNYRNILFLLAGMTAFFLPGKPSAKNLLAGKNKVVLVAASLVMILLVLPYCAALITGGWMNPFIYYRF